MKKIILSIICLSVNLSLFAQIRSSFLYGSWIKCKAIYSDGSELPDDSPVKYSFIKYTFTKPDRVSVTLSYAENGKSNLFELSDGALNIKSPEGGFVNSMQISTNSDTLILQQFSRGGSDAHQGLKYYLVREIAYQNAIPLKTSDIRSINGEDTIFRESPKIYARYKGDSFHGYITANVGENPNGERTVGHLVASFIVSEQGVADSLKILESINPEFDKRVAKLFNKARKNWETATLNGKAVKVQMILELRYLGFDGMMPAYFEGNKANEAYNAKDYDVAVYFYDQALKNNPIDKENLFKRGMCKMHLGNLKGACEDWKAAKALGGSTESIDAMLEKYCK
jgi:hypothetical protein